ncbi:gametogenetin-binding 2-like [Brachionus plicatilis]|uniref:Gametogenetin-binding 2-like n=1 Tax=Brachionus plicatilis TaxID=10195 RepID=A0A3M7QRL3_BRAPC|nr:gametogenetin-binding 2-like [Brachionus plicatilis]
MIICIGDLHKYTLLRIIKVSERFCKRFTKREPLCHGSLSWLIFFYFLSLNNSIVEIKPKNRSNSTNIFRSSIYNENSPLMFDNQNSINHIQKLNCLNSNIFSIVPPNSSLNKNRRCQMHSLDRNRFKSMNDWFIVWDAFIKNSTRSKILVIETSKLLETVDSYLKRHSLWVYLII